MRESKAPNFSALVPIAFLLGTASFVLGITVISALLWAATSFGIFPVVVDMRQARVTCYALAANALAWATYEKIGAGCRTKHRFVFLGWIIFLNLCLLSFIRAHSFVDTLWFLGLGIGLNIYVVYDEVNKHEKAADKELSDIRLEYTTLKETFDSLPVHRPLGPGETIIDLIFEELGPTGAKNSDKNGRRDNNCLRFDPYSYLTQTRGLNPPEASVPDYRLERHLRPILGEYSKVTKEATLGYWNGELRLDIRKWEGGKLGKGISLTEDEVRRLRSALNDTQFGR